MPVIRSVSSNGSSTPVSSLRPLIAPQKPTTTFPAQKATRQTIPRRCRHSHDRLPPPPPGARNKGRKKSVKGCIFAIHRRSRRRPLKRQLQCQVHGSSSLLPGTPAFIAAHVKADNMCARALSLKDPFGKGATLR